MKGKYQFTLRQANKIKILLNQKNSAHSSKQKQFRDDIRDIGFYISDFRTTARGFNSEDFENLIKTGQIKIIE